jgi:hypothetical protein
MKQTITETKEMAQKLAKDLEFMDEHELYDAWHIRCEEFNYMDDSIFDMDDFNELMNGYEPTYIADRISFGEFSSNHDYFKFDGYGNLESTNYLSDFIDFEDFADEIMDNDDLADELVNAGLLEEWRDEDE